LMILFILISIIHTLVDFEISDRQIPHNILNASLTPHPANPTSVRGHTQKTSTNFGYAP